MGIGEGLLRLSVGLEAQADLLEDLARGFSALAGAPTRTPRAADTLPV